MGGDIEWLNAGQLKGLMFEMVSSQQANGHLKGGTILMPDALFMGSLITVIACLGDLLDFRSIERVWGPVSEAVIPQQCGCFKGSPSSRPIGVIQPYTTIRCNQECTWGQLKWSGGGSLQILNAPPSRTSWDVGTLWHVRIDALSCNSCNSAHHNSYNYHSHVFIYFQVFVCFLIFLWVSLFHMRSQTSLIFNFKKGSKQHFSHHLRVFIHCMNKLSAEGCTRLSW